MPTVTTDPGQDFLTLHADGQSARFHAIWLRDIPADTRLAEAEVQG